MMAASRNSPAGFAALAACLFASACHRESAPPRPPKAEKPTAKLCRILAGQPAACPEGFFAAATGLHDHLRGLGLELVVALLPEKQAVIREAQPPGADRPQDAWTKPGALIAAAEAGLARRGIRVCNLLPMLHEEFVKHSDIPLYRDGVHLNHRGIGLVGRRFASWAGWKSGTADGSGALWVGDCQVTHIRKYLEEKNFGRPQACWRNASANQMARETALLGKEDFHGVQCVIWLIGSDYLGQGIFPPVNPDPTGTDGAERRMEVATLSRHSRFPPDLGPASPYPDALAVIEFQPDHGAAFLGLAYAMRGRVIDEAIRQEWREGGRFRLELVPWEHACRKNPDLARIRQLDDQTNFSAARYWISHWQRLD